MGTRGLSVYRHRKYYFCKYHQWDSYPRGLGVDLLEEVPRGAVAYKRYVEQKRSFLETMLKKCGKRLSQAPNTSVELGEYEVSLQSPVKTVFIEWIYIIDLDYECFHVNGVPMFPLANLPSKQVFPRAIAWNSFGHLACSSSIPLEHQFIGNSAAPPVDDGVKESYMATNATIKEVNEIIGRSDPMPMWELIRQRVYEVLIGNMMRAEMFWIIMNQLKFFEDSSYYLRDDLPTRQLASRLLRIPLNPMTFDCFLLECLNGVPRNPRAIVHDEQSELEGLTWFQPRLCARLATHLDEEYNLQAGVMQVYDAVTQQEQKESGVYFGILFSFFHIVIVAIDTRNGATSHTPALEFIPSFNGSSLSTPGITALTRLSSYLFEHGVVFSGPPKGFDLPLETWQEIANYLPTGSQLACLSRVSRRCYMAARAVMRWPQIEEFRLITYLPHPEQQRPSLASSTTEREDRHGETTVEAVEKGDEQEEVEIENDNDQESVLSAYWEEILPYMRPPPKLPGTLHSAKFIGVTCNPRKPTSVVTLQGDTGEATFGGSDFYIYGEPPLRVEKGIQHGSITEELFFPKYCTQRIIYAAHPIEEGTLRAYLP